MTVSGIRTRQFWLFNCKGAHTFALVQAPTALRQNLRVMAVLRQRRKKLMATTDLVIFLSKKTFGPKKKVHL